MSKFELFLTADPASNVNRDSIKAAVATAAGKIGVSKISIDFKDNVLEVTIPLAPEDDAKEIGQLIAAHLTPAFAKQVEWTEIRMLRVLTD